MCASPQYILFFFQAEDGIRDVAVTGVQTCALPIWIAIGRLADTYSRRLIIAIGLILWSGFTAGCGLDRKSTRLNSSHGYISYAVFCLKKKNTAALASRARSST